MKKYFLIFLAFIAWQCKQPSTTEQTANAEPEQSTQTSSNLVTMPLEKVKRVGITLGKMQELISTDGLRASAELAVHRDHIAMVNSVTDGIVHQLHAKLHARVSKGQVIATISRPDLLDLQQNYLETQDKITFLQAEYDRYAALKEADATAAKNLTKAAADLRSARTSLQLLAARLNQYQIDPGTLSPEKLTTQISLRAPANGIITEVHTNTGAAVQMGSPICEIMDIDQIHLDLIIFEKDLGSIKIGQKVKWNLPAKPDQKMDAIIYAIDKEIDPEKRAVRVHASIKTSNQAEIVSGAFAEAVVANQAQSGTKTTALPEAAIVREGDQEFIFIKKTADHATATYEKIPVQSGNTIHGLTELRIDKPIPDEANIVISGAYYISAHGAGVEADE